jgi:folate-binding protein YgfZ
MKDGVDVAQALERARQSALVIPAPELATLVVTGGDRQAWLNGLITCDLAPLKAGDAAYGLFVAQKGRIVADAFVLLESTRLFLAVQRGVLGEIRASLEKHVIMEDVEIAEGAYEVERVHGPRSADVLAAVQAAGGSGGMLDQTGLGGALVFVPAQSLAEAKGARDAALAKISGMEGDDHVWEALRLERRVPQFGADFDATTYPQEAGLEKRAVSFTKGCYLGQEVVFMLEKRGQVRRKLVTLRVESALPPPRGAEVFDVGGENVGTVTSAAMVPGGGDGGTGTGTGAVAMAMVKRVKAEEGGELVVGGAGGSKARVIGLAG